MGGNVMSDYEYSTVTEKIIGCAYRVANQLGIGFLEKVYENALALEMEKAGLAFKQQAPVTVYYADIVNYRTPTKPYTKP